MPSASASSANGLIPHLDRPRRELGKPRCDFAAHQRQIVGRLLVIKLAGLRHHQQITEAARLFVERHQLLVDFVRRADDVCGVALA